MVATALIIPRLRLSFIFPPSPYSQADSNCRLAEPCVAGRSRRSPAHASAARDAPQESSRPILGLVSIMSGQYWCGEGDEADAQRMRTADRRRRRRRHLARYPSSATKRSRRYAIPSPTPSYPPSSSTLPSRCALSTRNARWTCISLPPSRDGGWSTRA